MATCLPTTKLHAGLKAGPADETDQPAGLIRNFNLGSAPRVLSAKVDNAAGPCDSIGRPIAYTMFHEHTCTYILMRIDHCRRMRPTRGREREREGEGSRAQLRKQYKPMQLKQTNAIIVPVQNVDRSKTPGIGLSPHYTMGLERQIRHSTPGKVCSVGPIRILSVTAEIYRCVFAFAKRSSKVREIYSSSILGIFARKFRSRYQFLTRSI